MSLMAHQLSLGPCCGCETTTGVRNVLMLAYRAAVKGHGWGCLVCGLPSDGCVAVFCDTCAWRYADHNLLLMQVCRGYPGEDGREPISQAIERGSHEHDREAHDDE